MVAVDPLEDEKKELYQELGDTIWDGIPYDYDATTMPVIKLEPPENPRALGALASAPANYNELWLAGPAKDYGGEEKPKVRKGRKTGRRIPDPVTGEQIDEIEDEVTHRTDVLTEEHMRARPTESLWWPFEGRQYRVTKAMMIPYRVKNSDGSEQLRHILVGYMGVDSHG
jgi:hypothetical protein